MASVTLLAVVSCLIVWTLWIVRLDAPTDSHPISGDRDLAPTAEPRAIEHHQNQPEAVALRETNRGAHPTRTNRSESVAAFGHLTGRLIDRDGAPSQIPGIDVVVWPASAAIEEVVEALLGEIPDEAVELRRTATAQDGSFRFEGLRPARNFRIAAGSTGMLSQDFRNYSARSGKRSDHRSGDVAGDGAEDAEDPIVRLELIPVRVGGFEVVDPRRPASDLAPFGFQTFPVSFRSGRSDVVTLGTPETILAGLDRFAAENAQGWNEGVCFALHLDRGLGPTFSGLVLNGPGLTSEVQLVRLLPMDSGEMPTSRIDYGDPIVRLGDIDWAVQAPIEWPTQGGLADDYWQLFPHSGSADHRAPRLLRPSIALRPGDLPGSRLTGFPVGPTQLAIRNKLGLEFRSEVFEVTEGRPAFAVVTVHGRFGHIEFDPGPEADDRGGDPRIDVTLLGPGGHQTRIVLEGRPYRLPAVPPGTWRFLPTGLAPHPMDFERALARLHDDPRRKNWNDARTFEVEVGATTRVELRSSR